MYEENNSQDKPVVIGKEKNVYSWRLDKNDPMPKGKKREPSLREKEKQI